MSEQENGLPASQEEEVTKAPETEQPQAFFTWKNRTFKSQDELSGFMEALAFSQGRLADEKGKLEKEVAPLRKFKTKIDTPDKAGLLLEVNKHVESGDLQGMAKTFLDYIDRTQEQDFQRKQEEEFWTDYTKSRKELFETVSEDLVKDAVFTKHKEALYNAEDPVAFLDGLLSSRIKAPAKKEATLDVVDETPNMVSSKKPAPAKKQKEEKSSVSAWEQGLSDLGFK